MIDVVKWYINAAQPSLAVHDRRHVKWYINAAQPSLAVHDRRHVLQWHPTTINVYWCLVNVMAIKWYQLTYMRRYWTLLVSLVTRCIRLERLWNTTKIWGRMFGLGDENENENLSNMKKQCWLLFRARRGMRWLSYTTMTFNTKQTEEWNGP